MFHPKIVLGAMLVCIVMSVYIFMFKDKYDNYRKAILGFTLITLSGLIGIINNTIFKLWPLSVLGLTLTSIGVILTIVGFILVLKLSKKKPKKGEEQR